jgi:Zn finger protein HypA/HybF involved in hydrogenase expression
MVKKVSFLNKKGKVRKEVVVKNIGTIKLYKPNINEWTREVECWKCGKKFRTIFDFMFCPQCYFDIIAYIGKKSEEKWRQRLC